MIETRIHVYCDKCHKHTSWPWPGEHIESVNRAVATVATYMEQDGWRSEKGSHICPLCVAAEKYPAQWAKEADPKDVMRLAVGHEPEEVET